MKSFSQGLLDFIDLKDLLRSDSCYNIMTHSILANYSDLLELEIIGESMYNTFIEERKPDGLKMRGTQ